MSAATANTSSYRSCSYRLSVNPNPLRAIAASASDHLIRSDSVMHSTGWEASGTRSVDGGVDQGLTQRMPASRVHHRGTFRVGD